MCKQAYIFPSIRCAYYLLGMSFRPMADARYDALSLTARFGYIIAHELAHNNINTPYVSTGIDTLVSRYTAESTRDEAFADILGSLGVVAAGFNSSDVCMHISQNWCARVPPGYYETSGQTHPLAVCIHPLACPSTRPLAHPNPNPALTTSAESSRRLPVPDARRP